MSDSEFIEVKPRRNKKAKPATSEVLEVEPRPLPAVREKRARKKEVEEPLEPPYVEHEPKKRGRPAKAPPEPELTREVTFQSARGPVQFTSLKKYANLHEGVGRRSHYEQLFYGS